MDHGLSLVKIKEAKDQDPVIQTVISLLQEPIWRTKVDELSMGVVHLWSQRESLVLVENILLRNFERADGTVLYQQVLAPLSLRPTFLYWVHNDPASGHFGAMKTQSKLQTYAYWPGWRKEVVHLCAGAIHVVAIGKGPDSTKDPCKTVTV